MTFIVVPFQYVPVGNGRGDLPDIIFTGDKVQWAVRVTEFSANAGYALEWHFHGATPFTVYSAPRPDGTHLLELSSDRSAELTTGDYQWQAQVVGNDARQTIATGTVSVRQGLFEAGAGASIEVRSDAKIALANIDALLAGKATSDVAEYQIRGRSLKRYSVDELVRLRQLFVQQVQAEEQAEKYKLGKPGAGKVKVHFR